MTEAELLVEKAKLKEQILGEKAKRDKINAECLKLKALVTQIMTTKSAEGITVELPDDSDEERPRRRRERKEKDGEPELPIAAPPVTGGLAGIMAGIPAPPAPVPVKEITKEEAAANVLRAKLRSSTTKTEFAECKEEAEKLGLKHEASMASRKLATM
jgi:hypothetical protein